jgi:hypothetical protein
MMNAAKNITLPAGSVVTLVAVALDVIRPFIALVVAEMPAS